MKEIYSPKLTTEQTTTRLGRGTMYRMGDGGVGVEEAPRQVRPNVSFEARRARREPAAKPGAQETEALRRAWSAHFPDEEQQKNPDMRSTIDAAIKMGMRPQEITSKGPIEREAREVIKNVFLEDKATIARAEQLLSKKDLTKEDLEELLSSHKARLDKAIGILERDDISPEQQLAILRAHYVGASGVFRYKQEEIDEKIQILGAAGFSHKERRDLMESGIAARPVVPPAERAATFNPVDYAGTPIESLADELNALWENGLLDEDMLSEYAKRVVDAGGVPAPIRDRFLADIKEARNAVEQEERRLEQEKREREQERKAQEEQQRAERGRPDQMDPESHFTPDQLGAIVKDSKQREFIFNQLFAEVDDAPGLSFEKSFSQFYQQPKVAAFITCLRREGDLLVNLPGATAEQLKKGEYLLDQAQKYGFEFDMRQPIHDVNFAILKNIDTKSLNGFVGSFGAENADIIFEKTGVVAAMHYYEQALLKVRAEYDGYIPYEQVVKGKVDRLARAMLQDASKRGLIKMPRISELGEPLDKDGALINDEDGNPISGKKQDYEVAKPMARWEINRALSFAKGMGIITGRFIEIAATSKLPEGQRFTTLYAQKIIGSIAPFRHVIGKYDIEGEKNRFLTYTLDRGKSPWVYDELKKVNFENVLSMANDTDGHKGFLGVLNPFKVGGIFSNTTWRVSEDPTASLLGDMINRGENEWIGTGIAIEKARGGLKHEHTGKPDHALAKIRAMSAEERNRIKAMTPEELKKKPDEIKAELKREKAMIIVVENLEKIKARLPLQLFYDVASVQKKALERLSIHKGKAISITDPELQKDLDELALLQEVAVEEQKSELDFAITTDPARQAGVRTLVEAIQAAFDPGEEEKLIERLADSEEQSFIFGSTDIPHEKYRYGRPGGNAIHRRWNDILDADTATSALLGNEGLIANTPRFQSPHDLVKAMHPIYLAVANYDRDAAEEVMMRLGEGLMKFYGKDWMHRLPGGIGTLKGVADGEDSFARFAFGRGAMAWDETNLSEFTRILRAEGLITEKKQHELQGKAGGSRVAVGVDAFRTLAPLIAFALLYYVVSKAATEK